MLGGHKIVTKYSIWLWKNLEFYADFLFDEVVFKNAPKQIKFTWYIKKVVVLHSVSIYFVQGDFVHTLSELDLDLEKKNLENQRPLLNHYKWENFYIVTALDFD